MAYLLRKITKSKWDLTAYMKNKSVGSIPADALTHCLKTDSNNLSVWETDSMDWKVNSTLLATIFSNADGPNRSQILILDKDMLLASNISIEENPGESAAIDEVNECHRDLSLLDYNAMGTIAGTLAHIISEYSSLPAKEARNYAYYKQFTEKETKNIVENAIKEGKIDPYKIKSERWKEKLSGLFD